MAMSDALFLLLGGLLGYAVGAPDETVWHLAIGGITLAVIARCGLQISYAANNRLTQLRIDEEAARDRRREINRRVTLMKLSRD
jgi:4-hydroxybenzoate polyprenyltransferase